MFWPSVIRMLAKHPRGDARKFSPENSALRVFKYPAWLIDSSGHNMWYIHNPNRNPNRNPNLALSTPES
jgi:hypothetical protein